MLAGVAAPVAGELVRGRVRGGGGLLLHRVRDDGCLLGGLRHAALDGSAVLDLLCRRCDLLIASPTGLGAEHIAERDPGQDRSEEHTSNSSHYSATRMPSSD